MASEVRNKVKDILVKIKGNEFCSDAKHKLFSGGYEVPKVCIKCHKQFDFDGQEEIDKAATAILAVIGEEIGKAIVKPEECCCMEGHCSCVTVNGTLTDLRARLEKK